MQFVVHKMSCLHFRLSFAGLTFVLFGAAVRQRGSVIRQKTIGDISMDVVVSQQLRVTVLYRTNLNYDK